MASEDIARVSLRTWVACTIVAWATATVLTSVPSSIPDLTPAQWREDIHAFSRELLQRHANPFHSTTREAFEAAVRDLSDRVEALDDLDVVVGLHRLTALIGDGHTFLHTFDRYRWLPVHVVWFGDELRVVRTVGAYRQILGTRVVDLDGHDVKEVHRRLQPLIPHAENEWFVLHQSAFLFSRLEPLIAVKVLRGVGPAPFTFEDDTGTKFVVNVEPVAPDERVSWIETTPRPLFLDQPDSPFWFTYLRDRDTVYVNFRRYDDIAKRAGDLVRFIETQHPSRVVIDMRQNPGGNYTLVREHLIYRLQFMAWLNRPGGLYVITGRETFSAAMTNVTDFRRETAAILVGEPTGARPNGYQELATFTLPNSQLRVSCSILHYRFQENDLPAVMPDQRIDPSWTAFREGRDPAMEWILQQPLPARRDEHRAGGHNVR